MGSISDPALRARITPAHEVGCKRILLSDDYLPALERDNVDLVTDPIDHFDKTGLVTDRGDRIDADLVVMATGFQATKLFGDMVITGPDTRTIGQVWEGGIQAHRTIALAGFPDFFMMYGPGSNLGHSSIIIMIEAQAQLVARLIREAGQRGTSVEPLETAQRVWNQNLQSDLKDRVWATDCDSWYKDTEGRIFSLWPHSTTRFIREMRNTPFAEFSFRERGEQVDPPSLPF
jgi:cation diffusion facilitator CzcD-associated flavoprotein CzcO